MTLKAFACVVRPMLSMCCASAKTSILAAASGSPVLVPDAKSSNSQKRAVMERGRRARYVTPDMSYCLGGRVRVECEDNMWDGKMFAAAAVTIINSRYKGRKGSTAESA